uniref:Uncharacterized protein n=1 Tax=Arundo donax TaxID=35708 RepID=A0A0A9GVP0_ARUDO
MLKQRNWPLQRQAKPSMSKMLSTSFRMTNCWVTG